MRQSITTKYLGPSNGRGSRIKAIARKASSWGKEQSLTVPYGYGSSDEEHCAAAQALAAKLDWDGLWVGGGNLDETGSVFVCIESCANAAVASNLFGREGSDYFLIRKAAK